MSSLDKNRLLIIGIIVILASAFLLAEANSKKAECESIGGQIVKIFDVDKKESCENISIMQFFAYAGIAIGISLSIINFVRRE